VKNNNIMCYKIIFKVIFFALTSIFSANAQVSHIVIGAVYGGGSNVGAMYKNDFIQLFNPSKASIILSNWTIQYSSAVSASWTSLPINTTIRPGKYYLIQLAGTGTVGLDLPTPDLIGTFNMSALQGKVALVNNGITLSGAVVSCATNSSIVDLIGYGSTASSFENEPAHVGANTKCIVRINNGCTDNDDNLNDFMLSSTFIPQNSSSVATICSAFPVTLSIFTAITHEEGVRLNWQTSKELNFKGFEVERGNEDVEFEAIGFIDAKSQDAKNNYSFTDFKSNKPICFYRLKCIDNDGSYFYSAIRKIENREIVELNIYPNPVDNVLFINHNKAIIGSTISIINTMGKLLLEYKLALGSYHSKMEVSSLPSGLYYAILKENESSIKPLFFKKL